MHEATPAAWLTVLSWTALGVAVACAGWLGVDQWGRGRRQQMAVMEAVWPVTALYFLMQVGMVVGYFTAWPVNAWLIRVGIKEAM